MIRHYLTVALRVLRKQRLYAAINIVGLSIAFSLTALIYLFVQDEFTFDNWHEHAAQIFRVDRVEFNADGTVSSKAPWMPYPFGEALKRDHPMVAEVVRMRNAEVVIRNGDSATKQSVLFADQSIFRTFSYEPLRGDPGSALVDPQAIVLTERAALRHFGSIDVVGKTMEIRFDSEYGTATVTSVLANLPANTNIPFDYVLPFERMAMEYSWVARGMDRWRSHSFHVFALLRPDADIDAAQATLASLWKQYYPDVAAEKIAEGSWKGDADPAGYEFVPLTSLHLDTSTVGSFVANSNPHYSFILIAIGLTILVLACINFIILTIGRGATRAAEIGVRKALGAQRRQLMAQFGSESLVLCLLALATGLMLAAALLPTFNTLAGKTLTLDAGRAIPMVVTLTLIALATGAAAGWYPSLVISRHKPSETLRGKFRLGGSNTLTQSLVVAQFAASIVLVTGGLVMKQQLTHIQNQNLGYNPDNVVVVDANRIGARDVSEHFRRTLGQRPDVTGVGTISNSMNSGYQFEDWRVDGDLRSAYIYNVDKEAIDLLDIKVVAGRVLDDRYASDSSRSALVNEAFAAQLGLTPADAVGKRVIGFRDEPVIVGVIRNMNFRSLHVAVEPMIVTMNEADYMGFSLVRADGRDLPGFIDALNRSWAAFAPDLPLQYSFLDEDIAQSYANDRRWSRVVTFAAAIAILIACMGLFGLAALTIARRTKEIGVRKVLGASVAGILVLVTRDFAKLVGIAALVGAPVAYFGLQRWLETFAYHVEPSVWVLAGAGGLVLLIAIVTVAWHAVRAASSNPVLALRYE